MENTVCYKVQDEVKTKIRLYNTTSMVESKDRDRGWVEKQEVLDILTYARIIDPDRGEEGDCEKAHRDLSNDSSGWFFVDHPYNIFYSTDAVYYPVKDFVPQL